MKIVVDTNILLVCISPRSDANWLWQAVILGDVELYVTTDILIEYEEILSREMGKAVADSALDLLSDLPNVHTVQKYYFWQLVEEDTDDNKFIDCAVAAGARYLVSHDKHFKILRQYPYFKIELVSLEEFKAVFENTIKQ